ncbi:aminotransferase class I/II-fold pyridoxal phosphate-dependent enzyme [Rhodocaloribacter litoris]|uniref:DegT/DnrJ/EryC1/StrS family aminotransferase n=1 Tax=Rhodocaloribacter litoris TaxID=2558931 RepID=UPI00141F8BA5|nr:aminotransferase class I/II-fold pyridoxal phosphate-dependent enzyme [Rhodocaloribacter litoris]QXD14291.1 aminotransferase class I/II-fold pyridoxal phosphate-dependent enzyme [Rhodocaloribacter litoris]
MHHDPAPPFLPYSRPLVTEEDIAAVTAALRDPILSQGNRLASFEAAFATAVGARHAVGFSSGTAALHGLCFAAGIGPGDEVIVPALTFAGTANAVRYLGGIPVFADIDPQTLCLDPEAARAAVTPRTRALLTVDFAGHPSDYDRLRAVADEAGCLLLADAAHAPGAAYRGRPVGSALADLTAFSFNPVKNMTAAEGGMVTTDDARHAARLRLFRTHGMTRDPAALEYPAPGPWYYEQQVLGFNYKLSELHAALGLSQLHHLPAYNAHRRHLARYYTQALAGLPLHLPAEPPEGTHAWHLYVVRVTAPPPRHRDALFAHLRTAGFGVQVHYIPVPMHPYYRRLGCSIAHCPETARYYTQALSLPLHPAMTEHDAERVVNAVHAFFETDR